ncbi:PLDc N-terminal domain-containing protein [Tengunoibacter tsumagoiensis]|uniref:Cardiolipin synthase N-terminal domain-containing protein n=1 Tax=Tengunoibacter tsumagoiensis TaxID=2014871 RepID=A0A401ZWQ1_9CHLR|nr:PLD nuclease N-terminal domain-containing protein [Tengunoibacter tsumagoiensis]GCE11210.1 hypothetical protein KTT_10690 [Tengunoibacter tsumagoiensis]
MSTIGIGIHFTPLLFACVFFLIVIGGTVFWIWAMVDCVTNESSNSNDKIVWLLIIIFTHLIGAFIYLLIRRPERIRQFGR